MPDRESAAELVGPGNEVATRVFAAPRQLVFEVWTVAEHFARWFGPDDVEVLSCEIDARPGGSLRFTHRFGDGTTLYVAGTFREVVACERLDFTARFVDAEGRPGRHPMYPDWPLDAVIDTTVLFEEVDDGTRVTVRQRVAPASAASHPAVKDERRLAREGWVEVLARLDEHLRATSTGRSS
jgi:uncharacterized protein YndB with AHSA1/START domain